VRHYQNDLRGQWDYAAAVLNGLVSNCGLANRRLAQACLHASGYRLEDRLLVPEAGLEAAFASASLARELKLARKDPLGRFDERAVQWEVGRPWMDELALELARSIGPEPVGERQRFRVLITHDVDRTTAFEPTAFLNALLKSIGIRRAACLGLRTAFSPNALVENIGRLVEFERAQGVGAYYFMMAGPYGLGRFGTRTDIHWGRSKEIARMVDAAGMTVGLHGSFAACESNSYGQEKERLEQATGLRITTHRNHYLRFDSEKMASQLEAAGITHDFSVGFSSRMGFRAGLGSVYRAYDWVNGRTAELRLVPLLFMDNLLLRTDIEATFKALCDSLLAVKRVHGCVSLLFHPETFLIEPRAWQFFQDIIAWCREAGADLSGNLPTTSP
jgi:hypothetical protein